MGQFGTLYNDIRNTNSDHTAWTAVNVQANDKIAGYGQFVLTDSSASFKGPSLDPTKVIGTPPGFNYPAVADLGNYSKLDIRWWSVEAGMKQALRNSLMMDYALTYQDYKDRYPYLFDTTGKNWGFVIRANWMF
ncbi:MAG: hypothetical protein JXA73_09660 [Acidobacteria bacterium]|nr:hypothetical protein [Acidobacteriota bacterium]